MRCVRLDGADPEFPLTLTDVPEPALPGQDWARVEVAYSGICGSDLHNIRPDGTGSRIFMPFVTFPLEMGHEMAGVIVEAGDRCPFPVGTRVAVDPTLGCAARAHDPCPRCAEGAASACLCFADGGIRGFGHGFTTGLGSGWADHLVAHASQLHEVPDGVDDRTAALTEPLSVAVHALLRRPPRDGDPVLVLGAGIIGLAVVAAARSLLPGSEITVLAKHDHQAAAAERLGAHHVVRTGDEGEVLAQLAELGGGRVMGKRDGATIVGGYPVVVEAVGTGDAVGLALRACGQRGAVHVIGAVGRTTVDLAAMWFKELDVIGTVMHAADPFEGTRTPTFERALGMLAEGRFPAEQVVTHVFPLDDVRRAVETAFDRQAGAIKVLVQP
jgi:threonine dehydrogenase-like Zn-dependent dehydrogenase